MSRTTPPSKDSTNGDSAAPAPFTTALLSPTPSNIKRAAALIQSGHLVAMPTETVYGLAGDALNTLAVARIFEAKERPNFDPLIVHVPASLLEDPDGLLQALDKRGLIEIEKLSAASRVLVERLLQVFWPGPLTIVLPRGAKIPALVTSGLPSVALRMPRHPVAQALLESSECFLAAPSANRFGHISPTQAAHVLEELGGKIPMILDGGAATVGIESSVLALDPNGTLRLLRPGGAPAQEIEALIGAPLLRAETVLDGHPTAGPGMLSSHYAPRKGLLMLESPVDALKDEQLTCLWSHTLPPRIGLLRVSGPIEESTARLERLTGNPAFVLTLSESADWAEAARRLFEFLRLLDASDATLLLVEPTPATPSLAAAIGDRLQRASTPHVQRKG